MLMSISAIDQFTVLLPRSQWPNNLDFIIINHMLAGKKMDLLLRREVAVSSEVFHANVLHGQLLYQLYTVISIICMPGKKYFILLSNNGLL